MLGRLPQTIQPERLAETGKILHGGMSLDGMTRLAGYLHDTEGRVEVELEFGIDEQGVKCVRGRLQTVLHLVCQRCLQGLTYPMDIDVTLGLSRPEQAAELPGYYEPLVIDEPAVELAKIVEDELILALPIVPMHPLAECGVDREWIIATETKPALVKEKRHSLAGLAELMKNRR